ncbi:sodium:solute symporter family transporter [Gellertiella hungarica]|uniref:SSS family solute:Na+ symporter n=1 Tax=Gellertiella hungarica TaxID=1572859 RepID=A0A7W6NLZ6_9HYPH|nr:SSS family solute:Na+ symporter [Gellertiella hungarica]
MIWLPLYGLFYAIATLYWARIATRANGDYQTYFSAGHALAPWMSVLVIAGASLSGWALLAGSAEIGRNGFGLPALMQAGIALALPGVLFFKRIWLLGQRLRLSSLTELLRAYWGSEFLAAFSAVVAVIFAVAFAGLQLRALSGLAADLSGGMVSREIASVLLGLILVSYVVIGGMRAVGALGTVQAVLAASAVVVLAAFALVDAGGFAALNAGLARLAADPATAGRFLVAGVIQFTAGIGREAAAGHEGTALASLSFAMALMGVQASPMIMKVVLSTASPRGFAAGQTWVMAGAFGALVAFCMATVGAVALIDPAHGLGGLLAGLSPWFSAWLFIGLLAGVQLMAGLALLAAGEALVRHLYKPWFHSTLSRRDTVTLVRVAVGLGLLASLLMQALTPVALTLLASLALPLAFQLSIPLLGMTWLRWMTPPAVVTGVGFGIAGVLLTEPFGIAVLSFFGLDLPWGRNPWTIHSAAWGMAANLAVTLLVSAFTQRRGFGEEGQEARRFLFGLLGGNPRVRALRSTAWSVTLAWLFLALGPGLIFGNYAFADAEGHWVLGMPPIWGWSLMLWVAGVVLVWFLSYKMELASPVLVDVPAYEPRPKLPRRQGEAERERRRIALITLAIGFSLAVIAALSFGQA